MQYDLLRLLVPPHGRLFVVGDADQVRRSTARARHQRRCTEPS